MARVKRREVAWAAGLFDGEGCVYFKNRKPSSCQLRVGMTHEPTIARLVDIFSALGAKPYLWQGPVSNGGDKTYFIVTISRRYDVALLAKELIRYSTTKKEELEIALAAASRVINGEGMAEVNADMLSSLPPPKYKRKQAA